MSTVVPARDTNVTAGHGGRVSNWRIFLRETRLEYVRLLRTPSFSIPTITFPVLFYILFGIVLARSHQDPESMRRMLALYVVFGSLAPGLFGLGITLALERDQGLLQLKRALPMPAGAYLGAKVAMAIVFAAIVCLILLGVGMTVAEVMLDFALCARLFGLSLFSVLPFCGLGLLLGTMVKSSAAPAILNLVYLPMSFLSGLLIPLDRLPEIVQQVAPYLPTYHLARLAVSVAGTKGDPASLMYMIVPALTAVVCFAIARRRLQKVS